MNVLQPTPPPSIVTAHGKDRDLSKLCSIKRGTRQRRDSQGRWLPGPIGRPEITFRLGAELTLLEAKIFDVVEVGGAAGVESAELQINLDMKQRTVAVHIHHINGILVGWKICSTRWRPCRYILRKIMLSEELNDGDSIRRNGPRVWYHEGVQAD